MAWNIPIDFWVAARQELEEVKPVFMLAESNEARDQKAFDADYDWNLMNLGPHCPLVEIAAGRRPATDIDPFISQDLRRFKAPFTRLRYTSNHDEVEGPGHARCPLQGRRQGLRRADRLPAREAAALQRPGDRLAAARGPHRLEPQCAGAGLQGLLLEAACVGAVRTQLCAAGAS